jgi:hypothetical protein
MLVYVRPSSEVTDDPSKLAGYLFRDGGYLISHCAQLLTRPPSGRYFSPALPSDSFAMVFPRRAISPGKAF